jgi:hypothetical protein
VESMMSSLPWLLGMAVFTVLGVSSVTSGRTTASIRGGSERQMPAHWLSHSLKPLLGAWRRYRSRASDHERGMGALCGCHEEVRAVLLVLTVGGGCRRGLGSVRPCVWAHHSRHLGQRKSSNASPSPGAQQR